ncbi:M28 family peptidase [Tsuneonella mangrovi]|uniref:M28 family peptidase n=1 Tax=Tsuneonella mangrovi TaxID=1982042 RepID=UPI000BA26E5F|nr:M28 family peptidase [Tsuneonella mangrovi]
MRGAAIIVLALLAACAPVPREKADNPVNQRAQIEDALRSDIATLASDDFGGRQPGTEGEAKTLRYLSRAWQVAGLESGTNDPAHPWFAPVELAFTTPAVGTLKVVRSGRQIALPTGSAMVYTSGARGLIERAPVLFVGNAGAGLDQSELAGRVAMMLWDHEGDVEQREALLRAGASAVLAVVADDDELAHLAEERRRGLYRLAGTDAISTIDGYVTRDAAERMVGATRFANLVQAASQADFKPVPLRISASIEATSDIGTARSFNLIGKLPGKRPRDGAVLILAHWDHFGSECAPPGAADRICNGAVDNASGVAVMTELARKLGSGPKLDRDVYFLATTAEERGLLGAEAFTENPPIPLDTIVAAFNLDSVAIAPGGSPVAIVGKGLTTLDAAVEKIVRESGREMGDETVASQFVRRQDGWALLQHDVPAISVSSAYASGKPFDKFMAERYHKPSDEIGGIELGGAVDDTLLHIRLVRFFANTLDWPGSTKNIPPAH